MSELREKAWKELENQYHNSVSHRIARWSLAHSYDDLPSAVVHMAKRCVLDAIGCAIGGHAAPGRAICEDICEQLGGKAEATIIGSGKRTNVLNAAMVNAFMIRYLDYNDLAGGGHNSDCVGALLAVAEARKANGADFINALVLSYELGARFLNSLSTGNMTEDYKRFTGRGWCPDIRGGINVPPSLGLLMGLGEEQIANAIGATVVRSMPMNHLDANDEEFVMSKNLRFGFVAYDAIMSCLLAEAGFTGPRRGIEGEAGFAHVVSGGNMNYDILDAPIDNYAILETSFKPLCTNYTTQAGIQSTIALCKEHDIAPDNVATVTILCCAREARHTTFAAKKYPRNGESADHSLFYGNALAIIERDFGPDAFKPEKFTDPKVLDLIERISFEVVDEWPGFSDSGGSIIHTNDGKRYERRIEVPFGHHTDPMSDAELVAKFEGMARKHFSKETSDRILDTIWNIEKLDDVGDLARSLVFERQ